MNTKLLKDNPNYNGWTKKYYYGTSRLLCYPEDLLACLRFRKKLKRKAQNTLAGPELPWRQEALLEPKSPEYEREIRHTELMERGGWRGLFLFEYTRFRHMLACKQNRNLIGDEQYKEEIRQYISEIRANRRNVLDYIEL